MDLSLSFAPEPITPTDPLILRIKIPSSFKVLQSVALRDNLEGAVLRAQIDGLPKVGMKRRKSYVNGLNNLDTPDQKRTK